MRLGRRTVVHFLSQIVVTVTGFAATFIIARLLGASALGTYKVALAIGLFWLSIPTNAVATAITKRMSESTDRSIYAGAGLLVNAVLGLVLAAVIVVAGTVLPFVVDPRSTEFTNVLVTYGGFLALIVLGNTAFRTARASVWGEKRVMFTGVMNAVERASRTTVQVVLILAGYRVTALVVGPIVSLFVSAAIGFVVLTNRPTLPDRAAVESVLAYSRYSWMGSLTSRMFGWMDTIVLSFFVTSTLIGVYEAAWGLASMLGMVSASVRTTLFPELSELDAANDYDRIHHFLNEGLVFSGVFLIPGLVGAYAVGGRVLRIYGAEFPQGAAVLVVLVGAYLLNAYASQFIDVLNAIDRPDVAFKANAAFSAVNLVANVALVWEFGWLGAAVATLGSSALRLGIGFASLQALIGRPRVPFYDIGVELVGAAVMGGVVAVALTVAPGGIPATIGLVALGATSYVLVLLALSKRIRTKAIGMLPVDVSLPGR